MTSDISFIADSKSSSRIELIINMRKVVSFKVDKDVKDWIELAWKDNGFSSRSDFIRKILEELIEDPAKLNITNKGLTPMKNEYTITFKVDNETLNKLDKLVAKKGYMTRSDFLRDLFIHLMNRQQ